MPKIFANLKILLFILLLVISNYQYIFATEQLNDNISVLNNTSSDFLEIENIKNYQPPKYDVYLNSAYTVNIHNTMFNDNYFNLGVMITKNNLYNINLNTNNFNLAYNIINWNKDFMLYIGGGYDYFNQYFINIGFSANLNKYHYPILLYTEILNDLTNATLLNQESSITIGLKFKLYEKK